MIPAFTLASPAKPSRALRSTLSRRGSLGSMKTGSIFTTADRHIGSTKPGTGLLWLERGLKTGRRRVYRCVDPGGRSGGEAGPGQRGFHQPAKLPCLDRFRTVVRRASFERIEPFLRFGNPRDHHERQRGTGFPYMPQQRHIAGRFAARKHNIRIQELLHEGGLRLLELVAIYGECPANLLGSRLLKANENYFCHDVGFPFESACPPGGMGKSGFPQFPVLRRDGNPS